jgi:ABC-type uncharacterized transport system permease subunit
MDDRSFLWLAQVFYAASGALTLRRLRGRGDLAAMQRWNYLLMALGFVLHTAFLYERGQAVQRCPLTNLFEASAFVAWAAVLFFLLIGGAYRVSFLGAFTAPLVLAICVAALVLPVDLPRAQPLSRSAWVEFHAAIAVVAGGALALAGVAGGMYLWQERQVKTRRLSSSFLLLPPLERLDEIQFRLLAMGFVMLSAGVVGGFVSYRIVGHWTTPKIAWAVTVWLLYAALMAGHWRGAWRGRRMAVVSLAAFAFLLVGYWGVSWAR